MINKMLCYIVILLAGFFLFPPVYGQESDRPKNGEGIHAFLRRHNREAYYKEFMELNKGKFDKNNHLLLHRSYIIPPLNATEGSGKTEYESLFGPAWAKYDRVSSELKGATFYIVSGHGGPDPGAIGKMGNKVLHEDEYAYDIALRLARNLMMRGAKVHIIMQDAKDGIRDDRILSTGNRETCMGDPVPLKQFARLSQRCDKINALYEQEKPAYSRALFIHIDSRSIHKRVDVFFYHSRTATSKRLAQTMRKTFVDSYRTHQPSRGFTGTVEERSLYVINQTVPTSLFVELGNIQNSYDQQRFILHNNRQALANWMCDGLITDYRNHKQ